MRIDCDCAAFDGDHVPRAIPARPAASFIFTTSLGLSRSLYLHKRLEIDLGESFPDFSLAASAYNPSPRSAPRARSHAAQRLRRWSKIITDRLHTLGIRSHLCEPTPHTPRGNGWKSDPTSNANMVTSKFVRIACDQLRKKGNGEPVPSCSCL